LVPTERYKEYRAEEQISDNLKYELLQFQSSQKKAPISPITAALFGAVLGGSLVFAIKDHDPSTGAGPACILGALAGGALVFSLQ
jgi:hypothetical protein